jgi:threonine aldolase
MRAFTTDVGVDVVSLGATKAGAMVAEAVVILNPELVDSIKFVRKSAMQLGSKMRFLSAQLLALFEGDLWLRNANNSNQMAQRLYEGVKDLPGIQVNEPQANALFPILDPNVTEELQKSFRFYVWDHLTGQVRWMCSWDTTTEDVDSFITAIKKAI